MDVRNCPRCGTIFVNVGFRLCEACRKTENEEFNKVRSFLKKNPGVTVDKVAEETGVNRQQILYFIKIGRLSGAVSNLADAPLVCERCEKPIFEGRLCLDCQTELTQKFSKTPSKSIGEKAESQKSRVRFLKRDRD